MNGTMNYYDALDWLKNNGYKRSGGVKNFDDKPTIIDFYEVFTNPKTGDEILLKVFVDRKISFYKKQKTIQK